MKLRNKLMVASVMLIISVLMMTTASFAWFTISTAPEITGLKTDVVVNDNLEIALAKDGNAVVIPGAPAVDDSGKKQTTWGNVIDLSSTDVAATYDALVQTLRPAQLNTAQTGFQYPQYGADGRITALADMTVDTTYQFGNLEDGKANVYGYYIDLWLRTNVDGNISLGKGVDRGTGVNGGGSQISVLSSEGSEIATQMFADCTQVAYQLLGTATAKYTAGADGGTFEYNTFEPSTGDAAKITNFTKTTADPTITNGVGYNLEGTVITNATANTAYLVRLYIYLDGTKITNAGASITNGVLDGTLNIQFVHSKTLDPMDMPNDLPNAGSGS